MYSAYSKRLDDVIDITSATDLSETFCCPNPNCPAELKIRSADGKLAKHFANIRGLAKHKNCSFAFASENYDNYDDIITEPLENILQQTRARKYEGKPSPSKSPNKESEERTKYIRTIKQLFSFCMNSSLSTEYFKETYVDDIILDSRNILVDDRVLGIAGLRFLSGTTYKYNDISKTISFSISARKDTKFIRLNAEVFIPSDIFYKIKNYIFNMNDDKKFSGKPIAVFGIWNNPDPGKVTCSATKENQIIFRF